MTDFSSSSIDAVSSSDEREHPHVHRPLTARGPRHLSNSRGDSAESRKAVVNPREVLPWSYPLAGFAVVSLLCLVYLGQYAALVRTQYQIVGLRSKQHQLAREQAEMELQVQRLTSLERVEHIASVRLGMIVPPGRQVLELHPGAHPRPTAPKTVGMASGAPGQSTPQ